MFFVHDYRVEKRMLNEEAFPLLTGGEGQGEGVEGHAQSWP
jgi:hypothetical protein